MQIHMATYRFTITIADRVFDTHFAHVLLPFVRDYMRPAERAQILSAKNRRMRMRCPTLYRQLQLVGCWFNARILDKLQAYPVLP